MANEIEVSNLRSEDFVPVTSRYYGTDVIYYSDQKLITFPTYKKKTYTPSTDDKVAAITPGMQYRPDLVSNKVYGVPDFWWKIMEVNGIKDVFDFKAGLTIRLPQNIF